MIRLVEVYKRLGGRPVLAGAGLEVPRAGVTVVVGRSGAGKSVLARCCVGLLRIDSGAVFVDGQRIDEWPEPRLIALRRRVPYVVQGSALLDTADLLENVALPLSRGLGRSAGEARARAQQALEQVGIGAYATMPPHAVGPGVRKRAALARALALDPEAVLYDEPTTGLDAAAARRVDRLIRDAADRGTTALVVSHDLRSIRSIADRVAVLDEGRIAFLGTAQEFFAAARTVPAVKRFLGGEAGDEQ